MSDGPSLELLEDLIGVASLSGSEGAFARTVAGILEADGYRVDLPEAAPGRPNVVAWPEGDPPAVWFSTHTDVVPPHIPPRREGDRVYGRGAADTKGPLVAMIEASRRLRGEGLRTGFLLVVGEEVDHKGAEHAAATLDLGQPRLILAEPTSNRLVAAQKGLLKILLRTEGVAAHSAFPERGVSAVHRLLAALDPIRAEPWRPDPVLGPTTWNVGRIEGGVAANVFAPSATALVLFRLADSVEATLSRLEVLLAPHEGVTFEVLSQNDPLELDVPEGFETCVIPFNTDARILSALGRVWLCGPGAIEVAHADDEHIDLADLQTGTDIYVRLARAAGTNR